MVLNNDDTFINMYAFIHIKYVWCALTGDLCALQLFYCLADSVGNRIGIKKRVSWATRSLQQQFLYRSISNIN